MIFYRSANGPSDLSVRATRAFSLLSLASYPAGALILVFSSNSAASSVAGYGLILIAFFAIVPIIGSSLQRIVGDQPSKLDEYELQLRSRAMDYSYVCFALITLMLIIYAAIARDFHWWLPNSYNHFNGLFWGMFLYASVIPVAALSWIVDQTFEAER